MNSKPQENIDRKPDIFVGGPPRSGTTILQRIMCQSRYTNPMVGEAEHFFYLVRTYTAAVDQFDSKTKYYLSKEELFEFHKKIAEDYMERTRAKFGPDTRLVLKSPWYTRDFPQLNELLPNAQFVLIARNPLDIVASQIEVGMKQQEKDGINFYPRNDIQRLVDGINSVYFPALTNSKAFEGRLIEIRYERLVSGDTALKRLMKFLQLPDLMSAAKETDSGLADFEHEVDTAFFSELWDKDLTNSRVGRYRDVLTPKEIDAVKEGTKEFRMAFGYD